MIDIILTCWKSGIGTLRFRYDKKDGYLVLLRFRYDKKGGYLVLLRFRYDKKDGYLVPSSNIGHRIIFWEYWHPLNIFINLSW